MDKRILTFLCSNFSSLYIYIVYANHTPGLSIDKTHKQENHHKMHCTGPIVISPTIASRILARSHTLAEIDLEIMSKVIPLLLLNQRRVPLSNKRKYVHEVLVNYLVKPAHEKMWLGELIVST